MPPGRYSSLSLQGIGVKKLKFHSYPHLEFHQDRAPSRQDLEPLLNLDKTDQSQMNFQHVKIMKQVVVHTVGGHSSGGRGKRGGWHNRRGTFRSRQWRDGSRSSVPAISGAITDVVPIPISPPNEVNQVENEKINSDFTAQDVDQSECQTPPHIADEPDIAFVEADVVLGDPKINGPVVAEEDTVMSHEPPLNALELSKKRDQENADAAIRAKIRRLERQLQKSHENQENLRQQLQEEQERRERRDQRKAEKRRLRELQLEQLNEPKKKNVVTLREEIKKKMPQRKVD
ncbi:unnamed protein product [Bursaphelenchus xylophilus]|uniref:(pine wood nematode) hypothetical protein n=1 Tax=Bursaphelenchus xylophilus TaxID=6326 RepID=A0A811M1K7_BURXY|nr:unnamed protein product [Bursaphelenchus xylophilus]CAG9126699.1 unnamed protein product [Bursaphelenchus xylophilus]